MSRLLTHPQMRDVTVAAILYALADPIRLAIVRELLKVRGGMNCTQTAQKLQRPMPKSTCSQHYRVLRESGLIASERHGVDLICCVRAAELEARFPGLLASILAASRKERGSRARPRAL